jgi:hypothetical protein
MPGSFKNLGLWQRWAEEARSIAAAMRDRGACACMLTIANDYEKIGRQDELHIFVRYALMVPV